MSISLLVLATSLTTASPATPDAPAVSSQAPVLQPSPTPADSAAAPTNGASPAASAPEASPPVTSPPAASPATKPLRTSPPSPDTGRIVVTGRGRPSAADPLQNLNAKSFEVVQSVDRKVVGPVAMGYAKRVPSPIRSGIHNVLTLLEEPTIFVNFLLQHKVGKAGETLARTVINATLGVGGLIDMAKRPAFDLPFRPNGFADTMGFYGVRQGPYLFLPLIGSTTVRDMAGRILDLALLPAVFGGPFKSPYYGPVRGTVEAIDYRVQIDGDLRRLRDESPDAYVSMRKYYLDMRQAEIDDLHGKKHMTPAPAPAPATATPTPSEAAPASPPQAPVVAPPAQAAPTPAPWLEAAPVAGDRP